MRIYKIILYSILLPFAIAGCKQAPVEVSSVSLNTATVEMIEGDSYSLVATVLPSNAEYDGISWASSNTSVAIVNQGTITALKEGKTTITASAGGKSATCSVTVSAKDIDVTSITLDKAELTLRIGNSDILTATVKPDNATDRSVKWSSSDASIVKAENGKVTAMKSGTATITAKAGIWVAQCIVTVPVETESISLDKTSLELSVGDNYTLIATVKPDNAVDKNVTWSSSDSEIAVVKDGVVTALKIGTATITAAAGDKTTICTVNVWGNIVFQDNVVKQACVVKFDANGDGEITLNEATAVRDLSGLFDNYKTITTFNEFKYFTNVQELPKGLFYDCSALTSVTLPSSLEKIGDYCFSGCLALTALDIPRNVKSLGYYSFNICSSLQCIDLSDSNLSSIGAYCFNGCRSLTSIEIPSSVKSLGGACFYDCTSLTSIEIPSSVTSLGGSCFRGCTSLTSIEIPSSVTSLGDSCFYDCTSLTSIEIPSSVTSLGGSCFRGCTSLTSIEIPSSVTSLGDSWFRGCTSLTSIDIPSSVTRLKDSCFRGCTSLISIEIPSSVESLGISCFSGCTSLTRIEIPSSVTNISSGCFSGCTSLTSIEIPSFVTSLGDHCFSGCTSLTSIEIPSAVKSLEGSCFLGCTSLTSIKLPSSVTSLGGWCFWGCTSLTSIELPSSLTSLAGWCFVSCTSLTSIKIPSSVTRLGDSCFWGCSGLTSVELPSLLTSLGDDCFRGCTNLATIRCRAVAVPSAGSLTFYQTKAGSGYLYVPEESIELYKQANQWREWKHIEKL